MSKYRVEETTDLERWDKLVDDSKQGTIFSKSIYLNSFGGKYKLLFVFKGNELRAGIPLILSEDEKSVILDDLVIYGGILFLEDKTHKEVRARSERFNITEIIIDYLTNKYSSIELSFSPHFEDLRPFLWHNYHNPENGQFVLDLRYTSYLDISNLKNILNEEQTNNFRNLDTLRQRNIREARRKEATTYIDNHQSSLFIQYYDCLMKSQGISASSEKLRNMKNIINTLAKNKFANIYITKNRDEVIQYMTVFIWDNKRAYYLFGAPNPDSQDRYKGTINFWDSFIDLSSKDIKEVDLEGINSPRRGWFKLSFGGDIRPYYEVRMGK